jgi:hypothetical protein
VGARLANSATGASDECGTNYHGIIIWHIAIYAISSRRSKKLGN